MSLDIKSERKQMPTDTFFFILTGLHGQAAIDALLADMSKEQTREEVIHEQSA
ncbi:MAG TPA: hypothetical protein VN538_12515 [Clostridia bacterium]|nr:hypothetical protein [Clostridia bacterium]